MGYTGCVKITLNGTETDLPGPCTVESLLIERGLGDRACAVEVNRDLVPKAQHAQQTITDGDTVEIVSLVGGG